jgi:hypothetical protein
MQWAKCDPRCSTTASTATSNSAPEPRVVPTPQVTEARFDLEVLLQNKVACLLYTLIYTETEQESNIYGMPFLTYICMCMLLFNLQDRAKEQVIESFDIFKQIERSI